MNTNLPSTSTTVDAGISSYFAVVAPAQSAVEARQAVPRPQTTTVWGTDFAMLTMAETVDLVDRVVQARRPEFIVTANLNYLMLTEQHPRLEEINQRSIAVLADGNPIVRLSRRSQQPLPCRVAGADLIVELAKLSAQNGYRIYLLGAPPGVAQAAADNLLRRFPSLQIAGCYSPPFRSWTGAEQTSMLANIREARTDILLVAFGQPKGEFWIYDNLHELSVPLSIQLGASFDFLAGTARRAPLIWQRLGLEWLYRALSDPRRLAPRYWANIKFLLRRELRDRFDNSSHSTLQDRKHS